MSGKPLISIVTTVFNSRAYLDEFINQCLNALGEIQDVRFEMIFVNDGSPDDSLTFLKKKKEEIDQITIIDLARNFGHHYAAYAGLNYSKGDYVFIGDCDLEVSPEILKVFYAHIKEKEVDVVYGYQEQRKGKSVEKIMGGLFWKMIDKLSDIDIPANIVTERLMTRKYVDNLLRLGDKNLFLGGMMYWVGHNQLGIPVKKQLRKQGSTYSVLKRTKLLIEAVTSFSTVPLRMMFYFGLALTTISFCWGGYLFVQKLFYPDVFLSGYVSLVVMIIFFTGTIEMSLGLIGLYLGKVFKQVQNRPRYIVKDIY